jgi:hypothetical protein
MGTPAGHALLELETHLHQLGRKKNELVEKWRSLFLPPDIPDDVFEKLGYSRTDVQEYASLDGF